MHPTGMHSCCQKDQKESILNSAIRRKETLIEITGKHTLTIREWTFVPCIFMIIVNKF